MTTISRDTKRLAEALWKEAREASRFYPVDRHFLEQHLERIRTVDPIEFISYHLATYPTLYSTQLLFCLPELWANITAKDIRKLIGSLPTEQAFYSLILFTYKYVQVDILQLILHHPEVTDTTRQQVTAFLKSQCYNLILQDEEQEDFESDELGIPLADWAYVRQKLLTCEGVKAAKQDPAALKMEFEGL